MLDSILGPGNGLGDYLVVLLIYAAMFLLIVLATPSVPLYFRKTFWTLYAGWAPGTFIANYLLYRAGVMSFMPWLNDFLHTFVWIGFSLGFLYSAVHHRSGPFKFAAFALGSLVVKISEHAILGTWELDHFFGLHGRWIYILGWSFMDGFYPLLSEVCLRTLSGIVPGLIFPTAWGRETDAVMKPGQQQGSGADSTVGGPRPGPWLTILLAVLAVWDTILGLLVLVAPSRWITMIHGSVDREPLGLLARLGGVWLTFALIQALAAFRWRHESFWIPIIAGLRASELIADGVYLTAASHVTTMGAVSLIGAVIGNIGLTVLFYLMAKRVSGDVDAPSSSFRAQGAE